MAQNYVARPVTRVSDSDSYASMLLLSKADFIDKFKSGSFIDVQAFARPYKSQQKAAAVNWKVV